MSLSDHWAVTPEGDGRFRVTLREDWYQGRGVYGGLVSAILARAMGATLADGRPLRTVHVAFTAPATAGPAEVQVERVRVGRSVAVLTARLARDGVVIASAQATFARSRPILFAFDAPSAPALAPVEAAVDGPEPLYIPAFCRFFEFRQTEGPTSFSGGADAHLGGWCRPRAPTRLGPELVLALLDAWAPAALCRREGWAPAASVDLSADLPAAYPDVDAETFFAYVADSTAARDGYADERASLYAPDGTWLGSTRQLIALFDP